MLWHKCRCGTLIPQGIAQCPACAQGAGRQMSRHMEYNLFRRNKKTAQFYVSKEWRAMRGYILSRYDGLDLYAFHVQHRIATADMVHHIVEIEDDWHLFSALNFPPDHPARDMQDTFFVQKEEGKQDIALRTHTSSVQVRVMETHKPPIRIIAPGRVFRNEAISARAHCIFHQVEALYVDKKVTFADLKQTLLYFAKEMFGEQTQIRLRPSYFPFTEPSAEMDISCNICGGKGCNICKGTGWLEILGCGMVDPNVLEACGIDSKEYSGFALGMGVERMAMLKYQIRDLRLYFENDLRFLHQFDNII